MRTVTIEIPDDVYEYARRVGKFRHDSMEAYLADLLCAAARRELREADEEHDGPHIEEDEGGGIRLRGDRGHGREW